MSHDQVNCAIVYDTVEKKVHVYTVHRTSDRPIIIVCLLHDSCQ